MKKIVSFVIAPDCTVASDLCSYSLILLYTYTSVMIRLGFVKEEEEDVKVIAYEDWSLMESSTVCRVQMIVLGDFGLSSGQFRQDFGLAPHCRQTDEARFEMWHQSCSKV